MIGRNITLFLITLVAAVMLVALIGTRSHMAVANSESKRLEGSWIGTITATDPPGLPPMKNLLTFTRDGNVIESRRLYVPATPFGPLMETAGHGEWVLTGNREFTVRFLSHPAWPHLGRRLRWDG